MPLLNVWKFVQNLVYYLNSLSETKSKYIFVIKVDQHSVLNGLNSEVSAVEW